jgi:hypothetical protein
MNYDGHDALRRDMAGLANNICDLKTTLKVLEDKYLPARRTAGTAGRREPATPQRPDGRGIQYRPVTR